MYRRATSLLPYVPPSWGSELACVPSSKLQIAHLPTQIQLWELPGLSQDFCVYIKRDDMTGCELSGNKVRKLEFLLADALNSNSTHIITCGNIQSNHCRATTAAATQLGLQTHLLLRADVKALNDVEFDGNLLLDMLAGANAHLIERKWRYEADIKPKMDEIAQDICREGGVPYLIPIGGSNEVGVFGYINAFQELIDQDVLDNFDDIVVTTGSGGTVVGLAIGNYLTGLKVKIHAVTVCDKAEDFHSHINDMLKTLGVSSKDGSIKSEDIVDIIDGYKGLGYALSTPYELDLLCEVVRKTGIYLDPTYTLKGVRGMIDELNTNKQRFKGNRILFIHTGGIYGSMDGKLKKHLKDNLLKNYGGLVRSFTLPFVSQ